MNKLTKDDLFPAPPVEGAIPPSEETLLPLIESDGSGAAAFALANVLAREGRYGEAIDYYQRAAKQAPESAELHTNLGVVLWLAGRADEGLSHLRQANLLKSDLVLPYLHSARLLRSRSDRPGATAAYEKVMKLDPSSAEPYTALAEMAADDGDDDRAFELFSEAYARNPGDTAVRHRLALRELRRGRDRFDAGDLDHALRIWNDAHRLYKPGFVTDRVVSQELDEIVRRFRRDGGVAAALEQFRKDLIEGKTETDLYYPVFLRVLFALGLMPDCYERRDELADERERWRQSLIVKGEHPFPHFRLGIIDCYEGKLDAAREELRICLDRLLPKKRASLRLTQLLDAIADVENAAREARGEAVQTSESDWEAHGFDNPFQLQAWKKSGLSPSVAANWRDANFSATQAANWVGGHIENPEVARAWLSAGFSEPRIARQWLRGGFSPDLASIWAVHYEGRVDQAIQAFKAGFSDPEEALKWGELFLFPWDAMKWRDQGFTLDDTRLWLARGIYDPVRATVLQQAALRVADFEDVAFGDDPDVLDADEPPAEPTRIDPPGEQTIKLNGGGSTHTRNKRDDG